MKISPSGYHEIELFVKTKLEGRDFPKREPTANEVTQRAPRLKDIDRSSLKERLTKKLEEKLKVLTKKNYILNISIHKPTGQYVIRIIDPTAKVKAQRVVREMPLEKFLDMVAHMMARIEKQKNRPYASNVALPKEIKELLNL